MCNSQNIQEDVVNEVNHKQGKVGRILLGTGILVLGLSYPLTLISNIAGIDYIYTLYTSVIAGSSLLVWGMAKFF